MDISLLSPKIEGFARRVGRSAARTPLLLYYILQSCDTSMRDKAIIATCLAYVILPVDLIPSRRFSIFGWADEILSIEIVFDRMRKYITPGMLSKAEAQLDKWIPNSNSKANSQAIYSSQNGHLANSNSTSSIHQQAKNITKKWL